MLKTKGNKKPLGEKRKNVHLERYAPGIFSNPSSYAENK